MIKFIVGLLAKLIGDTIAVVVFFIALPVALLAMGALNAYIFVCEEWEKAKK